MWIEYNPNPHGAKVGDCSVRAVAKALGIEWEKAYAMLAAEGFERGDMPSSDAVWGAVLMDNGFVREACAECGYGYNAEMFLRDHAVGKYVLAFGGHVAAAEDGDLYDSWNSLGETPIYYYREK